MQPYKACFCCGVLTAAQRLSPPSDQSTFSSIWELYRSLGKLLNSFWSQRLMQCIIGSFEGLCTYKFDLSMKATGHAYTVVKKWTVDLRIFSQQLRKPVWSLIFGPAVGIKLNAVSYFAIRWHYRTHNYHKRVTSMWTYWYHLLCYCMYVYVFFIIALFLFNRVIHRICSHCQIK